MGGHQGWTKNPLVVAKVSRAGGRRGREGREGGREFEGRRRRVREDIPLPQVVVWGHQGWTKNPLVVAKVTRAGRRRGREGGGGGEGRMGRRGEGRRRKGRESGSYGE